MADVLRDCGMPVYCARNPLTVIADIPAGLVDVRLPFS